VKDQPARAHGPQQTEDLAMILPDGRRDSAAEKQVLIGVDEQYRLKRSAEFADTLGQLRQRQPCKPHPFPAREPGIQQPARVEALVAQVDAQRPFTALLCGSMKDEEPLRAAQIEQARERHRVMPRQPRHAHRQLAIGNEPVGNGHVSVVVRIRIADELSHFGRYLLGDAVETRTSQLVALHRREPPGQLLPESRLRIEGGQSRTPFRKCGRTKAAEV
jgi:hypothetical protein